MSAAGISVLHMSKMIQIRNVPEEMHRALKENAAAEGMSLSDYIKRELAGASSRSQIERISVRVRARGAKLNSEEVVKSIRAHRDAE